MKCWVYRFLTSRNQRRQGLDVCLMAFQVPARIITCYHLLLAESSIYIPTLFSSNNQHMFYLTMLMGQVRGKGNGWLEQLEKKTKLTFPSFYLWFQFEENRTSKKKHWTRSGHFLSVSFLCSVSRQRKTCPEVVVISYSVAAGVIRGN